MSPQLFNCTHPLLLSVDLKVNFTLPKLLTDLVFLGEVSQKVAHGNPNNGFA
jgi:hypothetical protein